MGGGCTTWPRRSCCPRASRAYRCPPSWPAVASFLPRSPERLAQDLARRLEGHTGRTRVLIDGVGSDGLGTLLVAALTEHARPAVHVRAEDFWRPAGERFTWGREDAQAFRETWLDVGALRREVLDAAAGGSVLPRLWDAERDRSARAAPVVLTDRSVVVVTGVLLLGRDLPSELTVHLSLSPAALLRRGVPSWQVPAFTSYDGQVEPARISDVLVLAEDPQRLAVRGD